jgi:chemotaxis protein methyltransferase CheR
MKDAECVALLQWALPRMGMRWEGFRGVRRQVCKRVARRVAALGLADLAAYRARLERQSEEWAVLDSMCVITISRFYRDAGVFDRLRAEILPEVARAAVAAGERELRAWSVGCASGEEAYTFGMLWRLDVGTRFPELTLSVVATDVDEVVLSRARRGCYEPGSLRELPAAWREAAFEPADPLWCVRASMREGIDFRREDVRERIPGGPMHVVLCRHVIFTYFDEATQRALAERIAQHTAPFGVLVVGTHETVPAGAGWVPGPAGTHTYRRAG